MSADVSPDDVVWLPLTNNLAFGELLLLGDIAPGTTSADAATSAVHSEAILTLRDIHSQRQSFWGEPSSVTTTEELVVEEMASYSQHYFLATFAYYIVASVQFLVVVQVNPIYLVDGILRSGKVERQAWYFQRLLEAGVARYNREDSVLVRYAKHLIPALSRMAMSDMFNPINKECIQLERLRELAGGAVSIYGTEKGWVVRSDKGKPIAKNVDGGLAITEAISTLAYGT